MIERYLEKEEQLEGQTSDSLLEMLMPLFSHVNFASNANDLSELTAFINVVSTPLEFLSESASENRTVSAHFFLYTAEEVNRLGYKNNLNDELFYQLLLFR